MRPSERSHGDKSTAVTGERRRWWQLRVWDGMTAQAWFCMLRQNRFAVAPGRLYFVLAISLASLLNSLLACAQSLLFGRRIERVKLRRDPIFILGHWRCGTTLLHELLALDPEHQAPTTYACLAPAHFLVSQRWFARGLRLLMPKHRSQDRVRVDFDRPQEDEWAICALGLPSPYRAAAFCRRVPHAEKYVSLEQVPPRELCRWKQRWVRFLKAVSLLSPGKRLVLKSPLHTARIETLLALFPDARFIHVYRDPVEVYLSTVRLWQRLAEDEGLQSPRAGEFDAYVLATFTHLCEAYEAHAWRIPPGRLCEIRYEQLIAQPAETIGAIYRELQLGDVGRFGNELSAYVAGTAGFCASDYNISSDVRDTVLRHWGAIHQRLGRGRPSSGAATVRKAS